MASLRDNVHGIYLNILDAMDIFKIPYHSIKVYKNGEILDISSKIKKYSIKSLECFINSSYLHIKHYYQLHCKLTNKYYIVYTTMYEILHNPDIIPELGIQKPQRLLFPKPQIYINDKLLSLEDQLYFKNHHKDNNLFHSFNFKNMKIDNIIIKKNNKVIKDISDNVSTLTIAEIHEFL